MAPGPGGAVVRTTVAGVFAKTTGESSKKPPRRALVREEANMASIPSLSRVVIGGVDTRKDLHVSAVIDTDDHVLSAEAFSTAQALQRPARLGAHLR